VVYILHFGQEDLIRQLNGAAEARRAHNPEVSRSKRDLATLLLHFFGVSPGAGLNLVLLKQWIFALDLWLR
jgi:hypothetical protein